MIEIRTQLEFDAFKSGIVTSPENYQNQLILVYPITDGYQITSSININCSDIKIVGVGNPVIQITTTSTVYNEASVFVVEGASGNAADILENIHIEGFVLIGAEKTSTYGRYGFYVRYCGYASLVSSDRYSDSYLGPYSSYKNGITIKNCTAIGFLLCGCRLYYCRFSRIINCSFLDNGSSGISMYYSYDNIITNSIFKNCGDDGVYADPNCENNIFSGNKSVNNHGCGFSIGTSCLNNILTKNLSQNNYEYGFNTSSSSNHTITSENIVQNNYYGGTYLSGLRCISSNNICTNNNNFGFQLHACDFCVSINNILQMNNTCGLKIYSCEYNVIISNKSLYNSGDGLYSSGTKTSVIGMNISSLNTGNGLILYSTSNTNNNIFCNTLTNNDSSALSVGATNLNEFYLNVET